MSRRPWLALSAVPLVAALLPSYPFLPLLRARLGFGAVEVAIAVVETIGTTRPFSQVWQVPVQQHHLVSGGWLLPRP